MNDLERAILEDIQNSEGGNDVLTRSVMVKDKPNKRTITKYLFLLGLTIGIGYCSYKICEKIWETEYTPLAIPVAIWGACATSYSTRKLLSDN